MILHLNNSTPSDLVFWLQENQHAKILVHKEHIVAVTTKSFKEIPAFLESFVDNHWVFENDIQLANLDYHNKREVRVGKTKIGGDSNNCLVIAGPCSVENEEQIFEVALALKELGITCLRAGAFKPRTSPYSFQGLGLDGLKLLDKVRNATGMSIVSEVKDATNVDDVLNYADMVQIGTKSMYDQGILRACGKSDKTVLLKRGFGTTLQEFIQAAEFILCEGNSNVILCERGIRTFETKTRFTLDLAGVAYIKHHVNLPVVVDPSHALGFRYGITDLSKAAVAMGVNGLLIEVHPNPDKALSDAAQQLPINEFSNLLKEIAPVANAVKLNLC